MGVRTAEEVPNAIITYEQTGICSDDDRGERIHLNCITMVYVDVFVEFSGRLVNGRSRRLY